MQISSVSYQSKQVSVLYFRIGTTSVGYPVSSVTWAFMSFKIRNRMRTLSPASGSAGVRNNSVSSLNKEEIRASSMGNSWLIKMGGSFLK